MVSSMVPVFNSILSVIRKIIEKVVINNYLKKRAFFNFQHGFRGYCFFADLLPVTAGNSGRFYYYMFDGTLAVAIEILCVKCLVLVQSSNRVRHTGLLSQLQTAFSSFGLEVFEILL